MSLVAIEVGRYELRPLIDVLEERGSADFYGDAGGITAATWEAWVREGLTAAEASVVAEALGILVSALWPHWAPETETAREDAYRRIEELRCQLGSIEKDRDIA